MYLLFVKFSLKKDENLLNSGAKFDLYFYLNWVAVFNCFGGLLGTSLSTNVIILLI